MKSFDFEFEGFLFRCVAMRFFLSLLFQVCTNQFETPNEIQAHKMISHILAKVYKMLYGQANVNVW